MELQWKAWDGFLDEYRTFLLEYNAGFSIGKYSILEFLRLSFEMWNTYMIIPCHKTHQTVLGTLIGNFGTHC